MKYLKLIIYIVILSINIAIAGCSADNHKLTVYSSDNYLTGSSTDNYTLKVNAVNHEQIQLSHKEKLEDFEYMYEILKENYPFFEVNKRLYGVDWLSKKEQYSNKIKATKNDSDFFYAVSSILNELHNGHTGIFSRNDYLYWKDLVSQWGAGNGSWLKQLNYDKSLKRYDINNSSAQAVSESLLHRPLEVSKGNIAGILFDKTSGQSQQNVNTKVINKGETAYLSVKSFDYRNIEKDREIIMPFLYSIKDYDKLIIDIRGNGGGNDSYWKENIVQMLISKPLTYKIYRVFRGGNYEEDFIKDYLGCGYEGLNKINLIDLEGLHKTPPELKRDFKYYIDFSPTILPADDSINFKGKIYLLVDKGVFSAAEAFAIFTKTSGFATIVGEKTGGDGIVGSPLFCALPNSGFIFKFSYTMGLTEDGSCNEEFKTKPDIEITQKWYSNIFADKSIEYVLTDKIQDTTVSDILKVVLICILIVGVIICKIWFKIL